MLFNSQIFLLGFLPVALVLWYATAARRALRIWILTGASLCFYGYWDLRLLPLLVASILVNWLMGRHCPPRLMLTLGISLNLGVLGVFKYADFFAGTLATLFGNSHTGFSIVLPLGISFFTFQQISYLVDRSRGEAPAYSLRDYALFVSFFPQLIAGPIVRHDQIIDQYALDPWRPGIHERFGRGLLMLACGLVKKVALADELAKLADPVFAAAAQGGAAATIDAWSATLAFGGQIYFDFSGYSDMAIGLALMFGLRLPVNFNAPYRATSISDFWRRWHMTLSSFLRDYLYIPLGGNRRGPSRQYAALLVTMLLGGLWHGAAWTFVFWGGIHGLALAADHAAKQAGLTLPSNVGRVLTFLFVMLAWIPFRAEDFGGAALLYQSLFGDGLFEALPGGRAWLLAPALAIAAFGPTSQQIWLERAAPRLALAVACGVVLVAILLAVGGLYTPEFIYFQF